MADFASVGTGAGSCYGADNDNRHIVDNDGSYDRAAGGAKHDAGFHLNDAKFHHDTVFGDHAIARHPAEPGDPAVIRNTADDGHSAGDRSYTEFRDSSHRAEQHNQYDRQYSGLGDFDDESEFECTRFSDQHESCGHHCNFYEQHEREPQCAVSRDEHNDRQLNHCG